MRKRNNKLLILIGIILIIFTIFILKVNATEQEKEEDILKKAFQEIEYAYYMRGNNIQYNSGMVDIEKSPEESTSQSINRLVCSGFVGAVYKQFGIIAPAYTNSMLKYGKEYFGEQEVIAYGYKDESENLQMKFFDKENEIENPKFDDIVKYLKTGDILTYTRTYTFNI